MSTPTRSCSVLARLAVVAALAVFPACQGAPSSTTSESRPPESLSPEQLSATEREAFEAEIRRTMASQLEDWNSGRLQDFVAPYADSTTFVGSNGLTVGKDRVLRNYELSYPDPASRGALSFELEEVRVLSRAHALVIGQWQIDRGDPVGGWFTLLIERGYDGSVRIVHDHSS